MEEDHYHPEILKLALREAVLNQAYSFNYIDRILLSWERKNLKTKQQVEEDQKRRKQRTASKRNRSASPTRRAAKSIIKELAGRMGVIC